MGTGYTRADTLNNIADGNIINASDIDSEYDAIESAFNESTGHTHDGTAAEGAPITVLGPVQDFIASATEIKPKTTNTLDIGTVSLQFKDMHLDGTAYLDDIQAVGAVDITGDLDVDNININGNTISSTDTNGNITLAPNGTGVVALSSTDLTFGDNDKAIFGAGSDLQVFHDATDSHVVTTNGDLNLQVAGAGTINLGDQFGNTLLKVVDNADVKLYHGSSPALKLATTATGVDVTGTVTADELYIQSTSNDSTVNTIQLAPSTTTSVQGGLGVKSGGIIDVNGVNSVGLQVGGTRFLNVVSGGDISFYDDTGTNPSFVYDASSALVVNEDSRDFDFRVESGSDTHALFVDAGNSRIGLGESSPAQKVHISDTGTASSVRLRIENSEGFGEVSTDSNAIQLRNAGGIVFEGIDNSYTAIRDGNNTERLRVNTGETVINESSADYDFRVESDTQSHMFFVDASTNHIGINQSSPDGHLHITGTNESDGATLYLQEANNNTNDNIGRIFFGNNTDTTLANILAYTSGTNTTSFLRLATTDAGTQTRNLDLGPSSVIFNEDSLDVDFRVESNNESSMLFVDGGNDRVGIKTGSPRTVLDLNSTRELKMRWGTAGSLGELANSAGDYISNNAYPSADSGGTITYTKTSGDAGNVILQDYAEGIRFFTGVTGSDGSTGTLNTFERMRVKANGEVLVGTTSNLFGQTIGIHVSSTSAGSTGHFNRVGDGGVVRFGSDGTEEGSINISGTTVSLVGGHLSRLSRLTNDSKDTSIVKGTVMTNLDEMVEWGDEENEQLNKMAVSSVEGDANVAGVFVNWDDEDDWNDMNVAMTGDMVIRIAQGTTVARGDLLMSAGDGTAKPQGDDIVRSKTIAKVTSTHVSHTYYDGSYLVPCVLMAC